MTKYIVNMAWRIEAESIADAIHKAKQIDPDVVKADKEIQQ